VDASNLGSVSIRIFFHCTLHTDSRSGSTNAVARHVSIVQITCLSPVWNSTLDLDLGPISLCAYYVHCTGSRVYNSSRRALTGDAPVAVRQSSDARRRTSLATSSWQNAHERETTTLCTKYSADAETWPGIDRLMLSYYRYELGKPSLMDTFRHRPRMRILRILKNS